MFVRWSFVRYLVVGSLLFLVDLAVVWGAVRLLGWPVAVAQVVGRTAGGVCGYVLHRYFTFREPRRPLAVSFRAERARMLRYLAAWLVGLAVSPFVLLAFLHLVNDALVPAKVLTEIAMVLLNFMLLHYAFIGRQQLE